MMLIWNAVSVDQHYNSGDDSWKYGQGKEARRSRARCENSATSQVRLALV